MLLQGFPYDVRCQDEVAIACSGYNVQDIAAFATPEPTRRPAPSTARTSWTSSCTPTGTEEHQRHFARLVDHRLVAGGHNVPQENPGDLGAALPACAPP